MTAREVAVKVLREVDFGGVKSDTAIATHFAASQLDPVDKAFAMHMIYGTLREKMKIDYIIQQFYRHDYNKMDADIKNILRIGVYQLFYLTKVPKWAAVNESVELAKRLKNQFLGNLVNGVLRNIANNIDAVSFKVKGGTFADQVALQYSHPKWLLDRWLQRFGFSEAQELMTANNQIPKVSFRINSLKTTVSDFREKLAQRNIAFQESAVFGFISPERFFDMEDFLKEGLVSVQSESQGLACLLLAPRPGERVLDMCAAPGGKSTFLAELMRNDGHVTAVDLYDNKLQQIRAQAETLGATIIETVKADARKFAPTEKYDKVLLDAPCSGTGVLARRAELRWRLSPNDIVSMQKLQRELLENAVQCVKDDGVIVYATCSLEPEENFQQIESFLKAHPEWRVQSATEILPPPLHQYVRESGAIEVLPHRHHSDGAFSIRLVRQ
ncbi:MAG: 16S rRNA (cytosine(967)-C(5))-methyltransferase RsmB [Chloroherpetonaceae bacterium]|nr:16S rRNA (cytosine(967)-C(5))-methyltransferase RsmB [Chloroherpetonaceae bacterium]MDW8436769.1 16S rRNA (cytosine(967)-C(5))-methyltransferase RsmB [Chloroherpetonaceae bacterium]